MVEQKYRMQERKIQNEKHLRLAGRLMKAVTAEATDL